MQALRVDSLGETQTSNNVQRHADKKTEIYPWTRKGKRRYEHLSQARRQRVNIKLRYRIHEVMRCIFICESRYVFQHRPWAAAQIS